MAKYIEEEVYYRLTYLESGFLYPVIQSFVYIGMNLSDEDDEDTWYFQFAECYVEHGSFLQSDYSGCHVSCATHIDIADFLDANELNEELELAKDRRNQTK